MAMMVMTGRVLLVCALCVLWCGAAFGHAMDDYCSEGGGNGLRHTSNGGDDGVSLKADCGLLSTRMGLIKAVEAEAGQDELSGGPGLSQDTKEKLDDTSVGTNTVGSAAAGLGGSIVAGQTAALPPTPGGSGTGGQVVKPEGLDANGGKEADHKEDRNDSTATGPQLQSVDQSSSSSSSSGSPGTQNGEEHNLEDNSKSDESSDDSPEDDESDPLSQSDSREEKAEELVKKNELNTENTSHEAPTLTTAPAEEAEIQATIPTTPLHGHSGAEDSGEVQQLQQPQDGIESNNHSQTKSAASIAANQQNEPPGGHAESRPPSPTANGDAANNESETSTEDGIPNNDPAADAPGTAEEKQNENEAYNPKETPVTATAMKNTTAIGDSDGSTAVPHTTSPLLLLLVVAAAAAVVAA
ncbi:Mucin-associated surface protein (MASP) subgroup S099 [Trypanosoma cruzi]|uniref:Mucin-associated surface protein (MASP) subgroup S099 n=1 Tax=Trypanosoma cruzi TaxID=5693 RepID=A0A7J6XR54_TRYCR|nr:Mucin-associated surface protein (MASP) subgroup S099 [Trypanosoma cruzi]